MRTRPLILFLALALLASCAKNPMGSSAPGGLNNGTTYNGVVETITPDVIFSPNSAGELTTKQGGTIKYSWGGVSQVLVGGTYVSAGGGNSSMQSTLLNLLSPGIGGPDGSFNPATDFYLSWHGVKGPSVSLDYNSLYIAFRSGTYVPVDLTSYKGLIFFARGQGNFGLQIEGTGGKTGQTGPYSDYNYYEKVFGTELSPTVWKEVTVKWSEMQQLYGQAVDKTAALKSSTALQFIQESPYTANFFMDIDYIRLF